MSTNNGASLFALSVLRAHAAVLSWPVHAVLGQALADSEPYCVIRR
jgi:hypothetical protein